MSTKHRDGVEGDAASLAPPETLQPASEKAAESPQHLDEPTRDPEAPSEFIPPNGGLEAWMLVAAGFAVFVNVW